MVNLLDYPIDEASLVQRPGQRTTRENRFAATLVVKKG